MIEIIKKLPIILALLKGKKIIAEDQVTKKQYLLGYSVQRRMYTVENHYWVGAKADIEFENIEELVKLETSKILKD